MRVFEFSELWGPFSCEHAGCKKETFSVVLTDVENERLPEASGPVAVDFILKNRLGTAACDQHLKEVSASS